MVRTSLTALTVLASLGIAMPGPELAAAAPGEGGAAFAATRLINLPTTRPVGDGELLFEVAHRFLPPITSDYDPYWYGLNGPAHVLLGLGWGITPSVSATIAHSTLFHEYELSAAWMPLPGDGTSGRPISAGVVAGAGLISHTQKGEAVFRSENLRFSLQAPVAWQPAERLSLLVVPGYASNANHWEANAEGTLGIGLGARALVAERLSLTAEWTTVLDGYRADDNGYGIALEYEIGGHVFQIVATNATGLTTGQYLPGAVKELGSAEPRLGFNIFRAFWL